MSDTSAKTVIGLQAVPDDEDNRMPMAPRDVFEICEDNDGTIMNARGRNRAAVAISAIETLAAVLFQKELDTKNEAGLVMSQSVALGLIQALGVCAEFVSEHINGYGAAQKDCTSIVTGTPEYEALLKVQSDFLTAKGVRHV